MWHHIGSGAPGREPLGTVLPTYLNGVEWYPQWPDIPDMTNRDCDCDSSIYEGIPPLAAAAQTATLTLVQARGPVWIRSQPSAANNYTLTIAYDDGSPHDGPDWYEIIVNYLTNP